MKALCEGFVNFFENKIDRLRATVDAMSCDNHVIVDDMPPAVSSLDSLDVTSTMEVLASIRKLKVKTCSLATHSTRLLKAIDC